MHRSGNSSTASQACAACKYRRRKCDPNCPLAPFFPPQNQNDFINAHKLFGVSNILKVIRDLSAEEKSIAMKYIIYHANARALDPVGGCYAIICDLQHQIATCKAELKIVNHQLSICRDQFATQHSSQPQQQLLPVDVDANVNALNVEALNLYDAVPLHPLPLVPAIEYRQPVQFQEQKQMLQEQQGVVQDGYDSSHVHNVFDRGSVNFDINLSSSCVTETGNQGFVDVGEEIRPLLGDIEEREETVPFDSNQCSDKIVSKEDVESIQQQEQEQDQDLKDAASLFTLTNVKR